MRMRGRDARVGDGWHSGPEIYVTYMVRDFVLSDIRGNFIFDSRFSVPGNY